MAGGAVRAAQVRVVLQLVHCPAARSVIRARPMWVHLCHTSSCMHSKCTLATANALLCAAGQPACKLL
eukprot:1159929-Pelagomonas_calceolata.AAC.6